MKKYLEWDDGYNLWYLDLSYQFDVHLASLDSQESDLQRRNRLKLRRLFLLNHHGSR